MPAVVAPDSPTELLVVGGSFGIREVGLDGSLVRLLSETPAQRPRLLPGGAILFLVAGERELRVFERATGKERTVAFLPSDFGSCPSGQPLRYDELRVHADPDFVVDEMADAACIRLQDRNDNMMDVAIDMRVDLTTGRLAFDVSYPVECKSEGTIEPCQTAVTAHRPNMQADQRQFGVREGSLLRLGHRRDPQNAVPLPPGDWSESLPSPSGRWVLVEGNFDEGDYLYRRLLLLDALEGLLYPIAEGDLSNPLTSSQVDQLAAGAVRTITVEGETPVRWHQTGDVLIVGSLLVIPASHGVDVIGDVAQ